jgi:alpha-tubulin suppressor-like RCC1 family protein
MVSVYQSTSAAITTDGKLFVWGNNPSGQLGLNDTVNRSSPVQLGALSWSMISVGNNYIAGITSDGKLFTWGDSTNNQTGGTTVDRSSPVQVGTSKWTSVNTYSNLNTYAVRVDGTLWAWGDNQQGQLANNSFGGPDVSSPIQIGTLSGWTLSEQNHEPKALRTS